MSMNPGGAEQADDGAAVSNVSAHAGYGVPSETYNARDQGTNWPADPFTGMVVAHPAGRIEDPARHSYDGDGNMEAFEIAGPYAAANETSVDLGAFTGAVGPSGRSTPPDHPELTAP